jgi:hypothetical protein
VLIFACSSSSETGDGPVAVTTAVANKMLEIRFRVRRSTVTLVGALYYRHIEQVPPWRAGIASKSKGHTTRHTGGTEVRSAKKHAESGGRREAATRRWWGGRLGGRGRRSPFSVSVPVPSPSRGGGVGWHFLIKGLTRTHVSRLTVSRHVRCVLRAACYTLYRLRLSAYL